MDENMVFLVIKEQLTHFKVKHIIDDKYKNLLAWWRTQEKHFSYVGFVACKTIGNCGITN
jgi:DNA-binding sugar fermentation-stimulating protein